VKRSDPMSSIIFLIISAVIIWQSVSMPMGRVSKPGPGFLPFWLGIILALLSSILWLEPILRKQPPGKGQSISPPTQGPPVSEEKGWPKNVILAAVSLIAYALLMEFLGFIISTLLLLSFYLHFIGKQKWWVVLGGSVFFTLISHLIFKVGLQVQLPMGIFRI